MDLESHPVPPRMGKVSSKPCFVEHFSPCSIHFFPSGAGADGFDRGHLGFAYRLVHSTMSQGDRTHVYGAGHIGTVTGEYNTPIQDYKSLVWNGLRRGSAMRERRPGSSGHN